MTNLDFKDVILTPSFSTVKTRSDVDVSVTLGEFTFKSPLIPANMICTIDITRINDLSHNGYFSIMHRFGNFYGGNTAAGLQQYNKYVSISVGVKKRDRDEIEMLILNKQKINFITIDIAHGHSILMKEMIEYIHAIFKKHNTKRPFIIAGNIATGEAAKDLALWGADAVKVGVAPGKACSTYAMTGFLTPMFSTLLEVNTALTEAGLRNKKRDVIVEDTSNKGRDKGRKGAKAVEKAVNNEPESRYVYIIADGGIRTNGDIAKAIVAGADMVMAGSVFAKLIDSPAKKIQKTVYENSPVSFIDPLTGIESTQYIQAPKTEFYKEYFGSASEYTKNDNKHIEGELVLLPMSNSTYRSFLNSVTESLQSAVSYAGGTKLEDLRNAKWKVYGQ